MFKVGDAVYYRPGPSCWFWGVISKIDERGRLHFEALKWEGTTQRPHWQEFGVAGGETPEGFKKFRKQEVRILEYMKALTAGKFEGDS